MKLPHINYCPNCGKEIPFSQTFPGFIWKKFECKNCKKFLRFSKKRRFFGALLGDFAAIIIIIAIGLIIEGYYLLSLLCLIIIYFILSLEKLELTE